MTSTSLAEVAAVLLPARRILIVTHVAPDGDAIGSLLGAGWLLRNGRTLTLACADKLPVQLRSLPGAGEIVADPPAGPWDVVLTLDASDTRRLGSPFRPAEYGSTPVINLDHHVTNLAFGTLNYVDPTAAATAQIVVALHDAMGAQITREAAVCLLTGIVTDTLSFRTSNVTPSVMATAMRLMECGASLAEITEQALNHKPLSIMRLWGLALSDLCLEGHVLWARVTREMRTQAGAPPDGDGSLVSYLINAPEARIAAVFSETASGDIEIGFRARPGYDVSGLALSLGGGGHPQAAGCTIPGPLKAAEARVVPLLMAAEAMGAGNGTVQRNPQPE